MRAIFAQAFVASLCPLPFAQNKSASAHDHVFLIALAAV